MELFMNGCGIMKAEKNEFYVTNEEYGWEYYKKVTINEFIEELKKMSWVCLTSWDKEFRQQYLDLVEYTYKLEKEGVR